MEWNGDLMGMYGVRVHIVKLFAISSQSLVIAGLLERSGLI